MQSHRCNIVFVSIERLNDSQKQKHRAQKKGSTEKKPPNQLHYTYTRINKTKKKTKREKKIF